MEISVELKGVSEALEELNRVARDGKAATQRALGRISLLVQREARKNAPKSPTRGQLSRQRKTRRDTRGRFLSRSTSRPAPGALVDSIQREVVNGEARIFVAANSAAGKYAFRMHEMKNKSGGWHNRGPGTVAKGPRADEKFIERAIVDEQGNILEIIKDEHRKAGHYELR